MGDVGEDWRREVGCSQKQMQMQIKIQIPDQGLEKLAIVGVSEGRVGRSPWRRLKAHRPPRELFRSKKYRPTVLAGGDLTLLLSCFYLPYPSTSSSSSSSSSSFSADRRRAAVLEEGKRSACQFGAAFPSVSAAEAAGR